MADALTGMKQNYRTMIAGLKAKEKAKPRSRRKIEKWSLYILRCADGSFYTGITNDVAKRFEKHQSGRGAKFTRSRRPLELVYEESCGSHSAALIREYAVKSLPKQKKSALIEKSH